MACGSSRIWARRTAPIWANAKSIARCPWRSAFRYVLGRRCWNCDDADPALRSALGPGLVRGNNEDAVYAGPRLLAIADGMGGHAAGEVASKLVIGSLERLDEDRPLGDLLYALRNAVEEANHDLAGAIAGDKELEGMGTTLTALRFTGRQVGLVHVGDSRAYLLRNGHLSQITHDDTYVQSLVDSGRLTAEEATHHPRKSVILRALMGSDVEPDVSIREARVRDRYLLCTDGLSDVVTAGHH